MRILVATNMYPSAEHPHAGIFVKEQVDSLRARGLDVDVFSTNPLAGRASYFTDLTRLRRVLRRGNFDLIHAHHSYSVLQLATVAPFRHRRIPLVFTFHEAEVALPAGLRDSQADLLKRLTYSKRLKRIALRRASAVISVSAGYAEATGFHGPYEVIPPGVDLDLFRPGDQNACRRELDLPLDRAIVLFPASPARLIQKGVDILREALALLETPVHVVYGGNIPHDKMTTFMNAADVVVQTSRFEASPMIVKEAMACNRPVVSTEVGDVRWIFGDTAGHFVTSFDPKEIARALEDALAFGSPTEGRARLEELGLSLDEVAARCIEVYSRLVPLPVGERRA